MPAQFLATLDPGPEPAVAGNPGQAASRPARPQLPCGSQGLGPTDTAALPGLVLERLRPPQRPGMSGLGVFG